MTPSEKAKAVQEALYEPRVGDLVEVQTKRWATRFRGLVVKADNVAVTLDKRPTRRRGSYVSIPWAMIEAVRLLQEAQAVRLLQEAP